VLIPNRFSTKLSENASARHPASIGKRLIRGHMRFLIVALMIAGCSKTKQELKSTTVTFEQMLSCDGQKRDTTECAKQYKGMLITARLVAISEEGRSANFGFNETENAFICRGGDPEAPKIFAN